MGTDESGGDEKGRSLFSPARLGGAEAPDRFLGHPAVGIIGVLCLGRFEGGAARQRADAVERLESRVRELRSSAPEVVRAWALAHFRMLADFINENEAIPESATAVSVAQGEQREWMRVHDGELAYVVQNVFYVPIDAGVYEREFGLIP